MNLPPEETDDRPAAPGGDDSDDVSAMVQAAREIASFIRSTAEREAGRMRASAAEEAAKVVEKARQEVEQASAARAEALVELEEARSLRAQADALAREPATTIALRAETGREPLRVTIEAQLLQEQADGLEHEVLAAVAEIEAEIRRSRAHGSEVVKAVEDQVRTLAGRAAAAAGPDFAEHEG